MPKDGSAIALDGQGRPLWLVLELTYRCPLKCVWCNNPLDFERYGKQELTTEEWKDVLRQARALGSLQLGFSGGEPMLREDLEELVGYASGLGYYTNLITSGIGLTEKRLAALQEAGLKQIQLSLQSAERTLTNELVGARAHDIKLDVARRIKAHGFPMVLNVPVVRQNIDQVERILALAEEIGVDYLEFANIQYYNWALLNREELLPTREQIAHAEQAVQAARARLGNRMTIYFVIPDYYEGRPKACMNGWGTIHLTIAPDGAALPCQEVRVIKGLEFPTVREQPLAWIWNESPLFRKFRGDDWMKAPCSGCSEKEKDFGGCRCQAFLLTGDAANCDPACAKSPHHAVIEQAIQAVYTKERLHRPLIRRQRDAVSVALQEE
jgi:pyrroloquinoline quinone biosynthesis protein E